MKKIRLLTFAWLLSATAFAANYTGIELTFNRTGTNAASVAVTVSDQAGNAINGVTATLESTSFGTLMTGSAQALSNGSVLAPAKTSSYASINSTANAEISYLFRINGLASSFFFDKADIDVYAMNANGAAQGNGGGTKRYFQFSVSTGSTSDVSLFAEKAEGTDICTVPDQTGGLYHSVQTMTATSLQMASAPLYVRVTLKKVSAQGCYAGIGSVKLYAEQDPNANHEFSSNKFYTIHKFNNANTYMHDLDSEIGTSAKNSQNKCWWVLIPTANPDCYYIMNAASGKFIQSPKGLAQNVSVAMGTTPVEFQIKKDETNGASTYGRYYIASTDQSTISYVGDVTKGLNWSSAYSRVVSWWIKTGRVNSYWEIVEEENGYTPPVDSPSFTRSAQIYSIPCGEKGSAYLSKADFEGEDVLSELHFSATAKPARHDFLYTKQKAEVKQGGTLPVSVTVANGAANTRTFAYTDWNKDGAFEASHEITNGTVNLAVPTDAKLGQYRVRIRVLESVADAETQAKGFSYDFFVNVVSQDSEIEWSVKPCNATRGTTSGEVVTKNNKKYLKVSVNPVGDAVFNGWKLMHNYFQGEIIHTPANSTDYEHEFELTQNLHLVAVLSVPTSEMGNAKGFQSMSNNDVNGINDIRDLRNADASVYTIQGVKVMGNKDNRTKLPKGIYIINQRKIIIK